MKKKNWIQALRYSLEGLQAAWAHEGSFRQECIMAMILVPIAFFCPIAALEKLFLIGAVMGVLIAEIFNSAIESLVDRIGSEWHAYSKRAKDLGSAAVLMNLIWMALVWLWIGWQNKDSLLSCLSMK